MDFLNHHLVLVHSLTAVLDTALKGKLKVINTAKYNDSKFIFITEKSYLKSVGNSRHNGST